MKLRNWSFLLLLTISVTTSAQKVDRYLKTPLPNEWEAMESINKNGNDEVFQQTFPADDCWWKTFGDNLLDSLINLAVDRNFDVLMAINRMDMAKYSMRMARSAFFPTVGVGAGWNKDQSSGKISEEPQGRESYYDAALNVSWEIDVFGSIRKQFKAQKESYIASKEDYTAVMVSLSAQLATAYISLRTAQQELIVVEKNLESQGTVVTITEARFNAGLSSKLDVAQAKSVYFSTKASIPPLELNVAQYMNTIAILMGMYPQDVRDILTPTKALPDYMEPVGVGIPADLIRRRPDIRSAERQVMAEAALYGASKADLLPQFFVKGSAGFEAKNLKHFFNHKAFTYEIAPAINWTIFSGGKLLNATKQAKAQLEETINSYNQSVLTAIQEADNAMTGYKSYIKEIVALREVCVQGLEALKLSLDLYKQGLSSFTNVVDAQRSLLTYQSQLVQAQGGSLLQLISLYQALGGGWNNAIN